MTNRGSGDIYNASSTASYQEMRDGPCCSTTGRGELKPRCSAECAGLLAWRKRQGHAGTLDPGLVSCVLVAKRPSPADLESDKGVCATISSGSAPHRRCRGRALEKKTEHFAGNCKLAVRASGLERTAAADAFGAKARRRAAVQAGAQRRDLERAPRRVRILERASTAVRSAWRKFACRVEKALYTHAGRGHRPVLAPGALDRFAAYRVGRSASPTPRASTRSRQAQEDRLRLCCRWRMRMDCPRAADAAAVARMPADSHAGQRDDTMACMAFLVRGHGIVLGRAESGGILRRSGFTSAEKT